jgi:hypothetical protein
VRRVRDVAISMNIFSLQPSDMIFHYFPPTPAFTDINAFIDAMRTERACAAQQTGKDAEAVMVRVRCYAR